MPSTSHLILVPSILTLAVTALRLYLQLEGQISSRSGGSFSFLGITWLGLLVAVWFGARLGQAGARPRTRAHALVVLLLLAAVMASVALQFAGIDRADQSDAAYRDLRGVVLRCVLVGVLCGGVCIWMWPRLGLSLLAYALLARLGVLAVTWWAKTSGWDTHYTKFGPAGIERDLGETMFAASVAQLGFWVPFTVVSGSVAAWVGVLAVRRP